MKELELQRNEHSLLAGNEASAFVCFQVAGGGGLESGVVVLFLRDIQSGQGNV